MFSNIMDPNCSMQGVVRLLVSLKVSPHYLEEAICKSSWESLDVIKQYTLINIFKDVQAVGKHCVGEYKSAVIAIMYLRFISGVRQGR